MTAPFGCGSFRVELCAWSHAPGRVPGFLATAINDSPGQGISRSSLRQIQTVLSKIFKTGLLIRVEPNSRL